MSYDKKLLILCLSFILSLFTVLVSAQSELLNKEVTIAFDDLSIKESLEQLEQAAGISTAYNDREFNDSKITISFEKELLSEVLNALLISKNLDYKVIGNTVTIFKASQELSQTVTKKSIRKASAKKSIEKFTMSGYVMDSTSKETLIGATVYCKELGMGATTNLYGFYSITVPQGVYEFVISYVGYASLYKEIELSETIEYSAYLSLGNTLTEIVVTADEATHRHASTQMSQNNISLDKVKSIPALMGERDVLKIIQLMPGVQSGSEGTTGLYVRGGGPDQNLMLLDGVPVYNPSHLFGFMSTFNGDAIKSVNLVKGGFPARYGGRLSSIVDVRMKEGNMKKLRGDFTVGLVSGRFNIEGPIVTDKTSFSFSGRRTWLDIIATPLQKMNNAGGESKDVLAYNLYDMNAKINHKFSDKSRLYLSSYVGNDKMTFNGLTNTSTEEGKIQWGNRLYSTRWNYQISPKLFSNTTLYYSRYKFSFDNEFIENLNTPNQVTDIYSSDSKVRDLGGKIDIDYFAHPNHNIKTGIKYGRYQFTPTTTFQSIKEGETPANTAMKTSPIIEGNELSAYLEDDMTIGDNLSINIGVHLANFAVQTSNYTSVQPRAAVSYLIGSQSSVKLSATKMTQFLHLLVSPGLGFPTDLWVASTDKIKPENAWQYGLGYTRSLGKGYELTLEGFYKKMDNLVSYRSGFNFFSNSQDWENKVDVGTGVSYGGEFLLEKTTGKTTGWIGYTLSKSDRIFPEINNGKTFPYKYDRRHDIGLALTHKKSDRVDFGLIYIYGTGNTYTLGTTNYNALGINTDGRGQSSQFGSLGTTNHIESRNNQRMPAYHRLDVSVNLHKEKKRGLRTWSLGVYNIYARQNPFTVYTSENRQTGQPVLKQQSLLPILPYFSYSFKF